MGSTGGEPTGKPVRSTVLGGEGLVAEHAQRFLGGVVGALIGDALGHQVAHMGWPEIRHRFGESGVTSLVAGAEDERMSDGQVILALSLDGRIRLDRALMRGLEPMGELRATYELWASGTAEGSQRVGWLGRHLPQRLAGSGALDAVATGLSGRPVHLPEFLYAAIPAALWSQSSREVIAHVAQVWGVLGKSGESVAAAQALAVILQQTVMTKNNVRGFGQVIEVDTGEFGPGNEELLHLMRAAGDLARPGVTPDQIETLGDGSTPASALAIAACAVQAAGTEFDEGMRIAVNHSGNSVVTGALAGAIMGASFEGIEVIPSHWAEGLSASAKLVFRLAQDVPPQLSEIPRDDDEWNLRYPLLSETRQDLMEASRLRDRTFAEAVAELRAKFPQLNHLHDVDAVGLRRYVGEDAITINRALRDLDTIDLPYLAEEIKVLRSALNQMPDFSGPTAYRNIGVEPDELEALLDRYKPGATVTENGFTSASKDAPLDEFGKATGKQRVQFIIDDPRWAKDLEFMNPDEREIVWPDGNRFEVSKQYFDPDSGEWKIHLIDRGRGE